MHSLTHSQLRVKVLKFVTCFAGQRPDETVPGIFSKEQERLTDDAFTVAAFLMNDSSQHVRAEAATSCSK